MSYRTQHQVLYTGAVAVAGPLSSPPGYLRGQIWTAPRSANVSHVRVRMYGTDSGQTVRCRMYATSGDAPTGPVLAEGTSNRSTWPGSGYPGDWITFTLDYSVVSGIRYAIVFSDDDSTDQIQIVRYTTSNPYSGGIYIYSQDYGSTWGTNDYALAFEVYQEIEMSAPFVTMVGTAVDSAPFWLALDNGVGGLEYVGDLPLEINYATAASTGYGLALDSDLQRIYVANNVGCVALSLDGEVDTAFGTNGWITTPANVRAVSVDSATGNVVLGHLDYLTYCTSLYTNTGDLIWRYANVNGAFSVGFDVDGNVLVAEGVGSHRLAKADGSVLTTYSSFGASRRILNSGNDLYTYLLNPSNWVGQFPVASGTANWGGSVGSASVYGVAEQAGYVVMAGYAGGTYNVFRYTTAGAFSDGAQTGWHIEDVQPRHESLTDVLVAGAAGQVTIVNIETMAKTDFDFGTQPIKAILTSSAAVPATIVDQSTDKYIDYNSSTSLFVTAEGDSPITYQWYEDSLPLAGKTNSVLELDSIVAEHTYTCTAINGSGSDTSNPIVVYVGPVVTGQSGTTSIIAGAPLSLFVTSAGSTPITYQWYKNSLLLVGETSSTYSVDPAVSGDAGTYYCTLTNLVGVINSSEIVVTIRPNNTVSRMFDLSLNLDRESL